MHVGDWSVKSAFRTNMIEPLYANSKAIQRFRNIIELIFDSPKTTMSRWPSWSKAPVSGTGPKGHGFESHS